MHVANCSFLPAFGKLLDCCPRYKYRVFPKWDTPAKNATTICFPKFLEKRIHYKTLEGHGGSSRNQINCEKKIIDSHVFVKNESFIREVMAGEVKNGPCTIEESLFQHPAIL